MTTHFFRLIILICQIIFRLARNTNIRAFVWNNICALYINWRNIRCITKTEFGARLNCATADFIQCYLIFFRTWEPNLTAFMCRRLNSGDVFVDVGANIGYFSLLASRVVGPSGQVIAIEASPANYAQLLSNIELNPDTYNIRPENVAASDKDDILNIYHGGPTNSGATSILKNRQSKLESQITAKPLDKIVGEEPMKRCKLVKIDVEDAELPIINNILATIDRYLEDVEFVIEMSPDDIRRFDSSVEEIFKSFEAHGFYPYELENDYRVESYLAPEEVKSPSRISGTITKQTDVIFSRRDSDSL